MVFYEKEPKTASATILFEPYLSLHAVLDTYMRIIQMIFALKFWAVTNTCVNTWKHLCESQNMQTTFNRILLCFSSFNFCLQLKLIFIKRDISKVYMRGYRQGLRQKRRSRLSVMIISYLTYLFPNLVTTRLFLETQSQIKIISLTPDNKSFLLFLICCIRLNFGFK